MQTIALHTKLKPGAEQSYEDVHRSIPEGLAAAIRGAGAQDWRIWRVGLDLFHLVEVEDFATLQQEMASNPLNLDWQEQIADLLEVEFTYAPADKGLPMVWSLAGQVDR